MPAVILTLRSSGRSLNTPVKLPPHVLRAKTISHVDRPFVDDPHFGTPLDVGSRSQNFEAAGIRISCNDFVLK